MTERRVAFVTGANRGIGFETVRQLARLGYRAVIGSRDEAKGRAAAERLAAEGLEVPVSVVDAADGASIRAAAASVARRFGRCDVLVNNAGILLDGSRASVPGSALEVPPEAVLQTFVTNTLGPLRLIQAFVPMMREQGYGRIVNVSSGLGQLAEMGGGCTAYRLSKAALNALTRATAAEFPAGGIDIKVNSVCPGWVRTDMGGPQAPRSLEKGAETIVWLATLPPAGPTGGFFRDRTPIAW